MDKGETYMPHGADIYAESEMLKGLPDSRCNSTV